MFLHRLANREASFLADFTRLYRTSIRVIGFYRM